MRLNFCVVLQPATRSSRSQMFFKIDAAKIFEKFTEKHLHQVSFLRKLQITATLKNICERLLLHLMDLLERLVFREAIFLNSLPNIFISNFYFTFLLLKVELSPSKKFVLFVSLKAFKKWWKMLFISS